MEDINIISEEPSRLEKNLYNQLIPKITKWADIINVSYSDYPNIPTETPPNTKYDRQRNQQAYSTLSCLDPQSLEPFKKSRLQNLNLIEEIKAIRAPYSIAWEKLETNLLKNQSHIMKQLEPHLDPIEMATMQWMYEQAISATQVLDNNILIAQEIRLLNGFVANDKDTLDLDTIAMNLFMKDNGSALEENTREFKWCKPKNLSEKHCAELISHCNKIAGQAQIQRQWATSP